MPVYQVGTTAEFDTLLAGGSLTGADTVELADGGTFALLDIPGSAPAGLTIAAQSPHGATCSGIEINQGTLGVYDLAVQMDVDPDVVGAAQPGLVRLRTNVYGGLVLDGLLIRAGYAPDGFADWDVTNGGDGSTYANMIGQLPSIYNGTPGAGNVNPPAGTKDSYSGLRYYPAGIENTGGSVAGVFDFRNLIVSDTRNGLTMVVRATPALDVHVRGCTFRRTYADSVSIGFGASFEEVERVWVCGNTFIDTCWAQGNDNGNPHGDDIQIFVSGSATRRVANVVIGGNVKHHTPGSRAGPQRIFLSDNPHAYPFYAPIIAQNLMVGRVSDKGIAARQGTAFAYVYQNACLTNPEYNTLLQNDLHQHPSTLVGPNSAALPAKIDLVQSSAYGGKNFIGKNIAEGYTQSPYNDTSYDPNITLPLGSSATSYTATYEPPADWDAITTPELTISTFTPRAAYANYGPVRSGDDLTAFLARWSGASLPFATLPSYVGIANKVNQAIGALIESEWGYIHAGGETRSITPGAGVSWREADDHTGANATAWSSAAGSVTHGKFLQIRATSSASASTTVTKTFSVGSESFTWALGTLDMTAYPLAQFDGTQIVRQSANGYGAADSDKFTLALEWKLNTISADMVFVASTPGTGGRLRITAQNSNKKLRISLGSNSTTTIFQVDANVVADNNATHRILLSVDLSQVTSAAGMQLYVDGVLDTATATTWTSGTSFDFDLAVAPQWGGTASTPVFNGAVGMLYFLPGVALDLTNSNVRDSFSASYVGPAGEAPNGGSAPPIFCVGTATTWNSGDPNVGTGASWSKAVGTNSITAGNTETWPPNLTLTATVQTAGPYSVGQPIDILVQAVGYPKSINITGASDAAGSWAANPQNMPLGSNGSIFTYTPTAGAGLTHAITFTNDGSYTNPAAVEIDVEAASAVAAPLSCMSLSLGLSLC